MTEPPIDRSDPVGSKIGPEVEFPAPAREFPFSRGFMVLTPNAREHGRRSPWRVSRDGVETIRFGTPVLA